MQNYCLQSLVASDGDRRERQHRVIRSAKYDAAYEGSAVEVNGEISVLGRAIIFSSNLALLFVFADRQMSDTDS